jgi:hypothetical protein
MLNATQKMGEISVELQVAEHKGAVALLACAVPLRHHRPVIPQGRLDRAALFIAQLYRLSANPGQLMSKMLPVTCSAEHVDITESGSCTSRRAS